MDFLAKKLYNTGKQPTNENLYIDTADKFSLSLPDNQGIIDGIHIQNENATRTVLVCPALMQLYENKTMWHIADKFYNNNFDIFLFNYPGMSESSGKPCPKTIKQTAITMYNHIRMVKGHDRQLLIYGRSMGTAVASYLANLHDEVFLLLDAPNLRLSTCAYEISKFPTKYLIWAIIRIWYDLTIDLDNYNKPFAIIRSEEDEVVPAYHSIQLQQKYNNARLGVMPGGHGFKIPSWHEYEGNNVNTKFTEIIDWLFDKN